MSAIKLLGHSSEEAVGPPVIVWPKGTKIRLDTKERGIIEMPVDANGKSIETVPETIHIMRAWMVTPDGIAIPCRDVKSAAPNGGPADE